MAEKHPGNRPLSAFLRNTKGATAVEYGIILMMVGLALLGMMSLTDVANYINDTFNTVSNTLSQ